MKKIIVIIVLILALGFFVRPPVIGGKLTSWWGIRPSGITGFFHPGSDIGHNVGTPVFPVSRGTIKQTGYDDQRGYFVNISHLGFTESRYYHLDSISVQEGEKVDLKSIIGTVGDTGTSTGPHLHFEIRIFKIPLPAYLVSLPGRIFQRIGL
ncbi:MAG: M23 family metallopeptidase [Treponema sp.]|nr:M23 family metallopeptidase [Treponema sp.]